MIWSIQKADCKDEDYYLRYVKDKFLLKKLYVYFHYSKKKEFNQIYNQLNRDQIKIKELVMKFLICHENIKNKLVFIRDLLKRGLKCLI
ncbi:hypothetical protein ACH52_1038 [Eubacterium limosum]|nr:hypothetical protein ACH52_1038 [Eubacterium limosum]